MIEFEVKSKTQPIGKRKGQTVYFAQPVSQQHLTNKMVVDRIVRETSLSAGDVSNALISLGAIVRDAFEFEERNNIWNTPYLFNAKEFDEETGLYYYGARYYEPRLGLWISADIEQETHPNVSTYTYCLNNPILFIDPDGKGVWTKVGKAVIKVGAKVGSHGFKALTQAATYTNAFSDVLNDVNTLTDNNSSKWDKFKAGASLASELLPVSVGDIKDAYKLAKKGAKYAEREAGNLLSISKKSTKGQPKGSISGTKEALKEVKKILKMNERETLPKNKGKFGSSMRGDSKRGYRLDPAHPSAKPGSGEEYPHINYWDYTKGKRGKGGLDGAVPIRK